MALLRGDRLTIKSVEIVPGNEISPSWSQPMHIITDTDGNKYIRNPEPNNEEPGYNWGAHMGETVDVVLMYTRSGIEYDYYLKTPAEHPEVEIPDYDEEFDEDLY